MHFNNLLNAIKLKINKLNCNKKIEVYAVSKNKLTLLSI